MNQKIVVMGGSFNPPTIAHQKLMLAAVNVLQADLGIYVPSSHEYVKRKMNRTNYPKEVLDADLRLQMLVEMANEDSRLIVDDYEYHLTEKNCSYYTMVYLQKKYPDAELFFLAGADKIDMLPRWYRIKDFLEQFRMIVTNRKGYDTDAALSKHPLLQSDKNRFLIMDCPMGIAQMSSSVVREKWRVEDFKGAKEMLHSAVYEMMEKNFGVAMERGQEDGNICKSR